MELSNLSNKELKNILRENSVKNYSKLNKKDLVKKVNQLIKAQNGGKSGKGKNGKKKKYILNDFIRGGSNAPGTSTAPDATGTPAANTVTGATGATGTPAANTVTGATGTPGIPAAASETISQNAAVTGSTGAIQQTSSQNPTKKNNNNQKSSVSASKLNSQLSSNSLQPSSPELSKQELTEIEKNEEQRQINAAKNASLQKNQNNGCGPCSIL
jgi:hypothetical protein